MSRRIQHESVPRCYPPRHKERLHPTYGITKVTPEDGERRFASDDAELVQSVEVEAPGALTIIRLRVHLDLPEKDAFLIEFPGRANADDLPRRTPEHPRYFTANQPPTQFTAECVFCGHSTPPCCDIPSIKTIAVLTSAMLY